MKIESYKVGVIWWIILKDRCNLNIYYTLLLLWQCIAVVGTETREQTMVYCEPTSCNVTIIKSTKFKILRASTSWKWRCKTILCRQVLLEWCFRNRSNAVNRALSVGLAKSSVAESASQAYSNWLHKIKQLLPFAFSSFLTEYRCHIAWAKVTGSLQSHITRMLESDGDTPLPPWSESDRGGTRYLQPRTFLLQRWLRACQVACPYFFSLHD